MEEQEVTPTTEVEAEEPQDITCSGGITLGRIGANNNA